MRRVIIAGIIAFLTGSANAAEAPAPFLWGVNGHPFTAYPGISYDRQLSYVRDLGMKSYRVNISDLSSVPALIELVKTGKTHGVDILPVLTPSLDFEKDHPAVLRQKSYEFAKALVAIFKSDIRVWELGNELEVYAIIQPCEMQDDGVQYNCAWGTAGGVGELDYFGPRWAKSSAVLKGLSEGARDADPTVRRAMGTAGWGHTGAFKRMQKDGIEWEISVWHSYGEDPEWAFKILSSFNKPIWVTELNHPFGSRDGEQAQAEGLQKTMRRLYELRAAYKVEAVHVYELLDEPYWQGFEAVMGLVKLDKNGRGGWTPGAPKLAYPAVQSVVAGATGPTARMQITRNCDLEAHAGRERNIPNQVNHAYCLTVGRAPDTVGLRSWIANRANGQTALDMLAAMTASEEFQKKYALAAMGDADYVAFLFQLLLSREPDSKGLADYMARLASRDVTRQDVVLMLLQSDEFRQKQPAFFERGAS